jgi:glutamate:GABA antiporter
MGYWMLTTQLVLLMYIQVFASAIRLRYTEPNTDRAYKVPGASWECGSSAGWA